MYFTPYFSWVRTSAMCALATSFAFVPSGAFLWTSMNSGIARSLRFGPSRPAPDATDRGNMTRGDSSRTRRPRLHGRPAHHELGNHRDRRDRDAEPCKEY